MSHPYGSPDNSNSNSESPAGEQQPFPGGQHSPQYPNGPAETFGGQTSGNPFGGTSPYGREAGYPQSAAGYQNYTEPAPAPGTFDAIDALSQAWKIFSEKPASWIVAVLAYGAVGLLAFVFGYVLFLATLVANTDETTGDVTNFPVGTAVLFGLMYLLFAAAMMLMTSVMTREAVYAVGGKRPEIKDFFTFHRVGMLIGVSLVMGLLSLLGLVALIIGSLVVSFLLMLAVTAAVEEGQTLGGALKASVDVVKNNLGQALILFLLLMVINGVAGMVGLGVIVSYPITYLAYAVAYLTARNKQVQRRA